MAKAQTTFDSTGTEPQTARGQITLVPTILKTIVVHCITYFPVGWLAASILDYSGWYAARFGAMMRPLSDPLLILAPLFQPIRGVL